jgi:hypothetical protein
LPPRRRIVGSPGSEQQEPPDRLPAASPSPAQAARLVEEGGVVYVMFGDRKLRLADDDIARLRIGPAAPSAALTSIPEELLRAVESADRHRHALLEFPNVISVRGGYKFVDGRITRTPVVVVAVTRKRDGLPTEYQVPSVLPDGMGTDVAVADPFERVEEAATVEPSASALGRQPLLIDQVQSAALGAAVEEAVPVITYRPPTDVTLDPVTGPMVVTCHVSPDAGWPVLRPFLGEAHEEVILGMYDFTAPHIYRAVRSLLRDSGVVWRQTLGPNESLPAPDDVDSTKAEDKPESSIIRGLRRVAANRFESVFARVGAGQTFASAYHIKLAVRDRSAFWLSSGNWQSSNQPAIDFMDTASDRKLIPRYNREWHIVVENEQLAETFRLFLLHDFETAQEEPEAALVEAAAALPDLLLAADELLEEERGAVGLQVFPPERFDFSTQNLLTVQPILTPDNYLEIVRDLLGQPATERLYFQNQSLNPVLAPTPEWAELLDVLARYSQDDALDVRIILRNIGPIRKKLESLQAAGFRMERVRVQAGCHTKGIVIDSRTVLLGSHNWTNQGVQANRDASLLIHDPRIARYFERVFLHDWEHLAKPTIREEAMPIPLTSDAEVAAVGEDSVLQRVPWSTWLEE